MMINFLVGVAAGFLAGWAGGWAVTSWWRDRYEDAGEEYADELAGYPHVPAYEPDQLDVLAAEMERRLVPAPPALATWVQDVLDESRPVDEWFDSIVRKVTA